MHHKIWLTLISILLLSSVGNESTTRTVQASHRHVRTHRQIRHRRTHQIHNVSIPTSVYPNDLLYYTQNGRTGYTRYYFKAHHYHTQMSKGYINSVVQNEYHQINRARQKINERPLLQNRALIHLAKWRAKQANRRFTHYTYTGQPLAWLDAARMRLGSYHYNRRNIGENMFYVGKLSQVHTNNGLAGYYFQNPKALASDNVFDSLNNDAAAQWSHGENIMMPQHRYVGIGTYYRRNNGSLYVLVEFSSKRPVIHKK